MNAVTNRRWFRFSLRAFLIFILVASIPLAWLGRTLERVRCQRAAVARIAATGGDVYYDDQQGSSLSWRPPGPWILRRLIGDDAFAYLRTVQWGRREPVTDEDVMVLNQLPFVDDAALSGVQVTDASVDCLLNLPRLASLRLSDTSITGVGLARLGACSDLTELTLAGRSANDDCLQGVEKLANLRILRIESGVVSESAFRSLKSLPQLSDLIVNDTSTFSGDGLMFVAKPAMLEKLELIRSPVTDAAMAHVAKMVNLNVLNLVGTMVTDEGIEMIGPLPHLKEVWLGWTQIGDEGVLSLIRGSHLEQLGLGSQVPAT